MLNRTIWSIAWRNVSKSKQRSFLFGSAIFFSCFLLLLSHAIFNGAGDQLKIDMAQTFTGEVGVYWTSVNNYQKSDPSRLFFSDVNIDQDEANRKGLAALSEFLAANQDRVELAEPYILRQITVYSGKKVEKTRIYSGTDAAFARMLKRQIYQPDAQDKPLEFDGRSVLVSQEFAANQGLKVGDHITLEARTLYGGQNALDVEIKALYRNKAPWTNNFILAGDALARELLDFDAGYFCADKLFVKPGVDRKRLVADLNAVLKSNGDTLVAETAEDAGQFFDGLSESQNVMFTMISVVIFLVIGMGMRSTMRMVLFQRMKEFGTLRAIGFSRVQCLYLVITEVVILGLVSLAVAVVGVVVFVLGFSSSGIRVPEGPLQYMFGGDHFYMRMALQDFILCVGLIAGLAFFSAFKPAGLLMYNRMTDILAGTQKRIFLTAAIIRGFTRKGSV